MYPILTNSPAYCGRRLWSAIVSSREIYFILLKCRDKVDNISRDILLKFLAAQDINVADCRGQSYDNASNMSGKDTQWHAGYYSGTEWTRCVCAIGLYRDVWIAAIASSRTSLATLTGVMCNTSQCELRSLRVNLGMLNVSRIVTYYTSPSLESPDSFWIAMAFSRWRPMCSTLPHSGWPICS